METPMKKMNIYANGIYGLESRGLPDLSDDERSVAFAHTGRMTDFTPSSKKCVSVGVVINDVLFI